MSAESASAPDTRVDQALAQCYSRNRPVTVVVQDHERRPNIPSQAQAPATVLHIDKNSSLFSQVQQMFPQISDVGVYVVQRGNILKKVTEPASNAADCFIVVRLLDGSSVRRRFGSSEPLAAVRAWLDADDDIRVLPTAAMPSFASPDCLHPTDYEFTSPTIPRTTYTRQQEQMTLHDLGLCPRSVVTLNPIYSETIDKKKSFFRKTAGFTAHFAHVLYSFFDYGVELSELESESYQEAHFVDAPNEALTIPTPPVASEPLQLKPEVSAETTQSETAGSGTGAGAGFDLSRVGSPVQGIRAASRVQTIQKEAEDSESR